MHTILHYFSFLFFLTLMSCSPSSSSSDTIEEEEPAKVFETPEPPTSDSSKKKIVFFGNSLTAAYGLDPEQGFTNIIQQLIDSLELDYEVVNAGLSGETTAGGKERVDWILQQPVDIFVLELGGNDGLRGIAPETSANNLQAIIDKVTNQSPQVKIVLAGMEAPPNMGADFTRDFREMYPRLAEANNIDLIPFLLVNVGGEADLNLPDGIHPNAEGQKIVAETVWKTLEGLL